MARASVVLPAPRPPCSATRSRGRRRPAKAAPSRSVAASSGRDKEKVGIFRCRLLARARPRLPCGRLRGGWRLVAVEIALEGAGLGHADILGLVWAELGELGAD